MDIDVLQAVDYHPQQIEVAKLNGFDIQIGPLANLVSSDQHCVYGIIATGTHEELDRLYGKYVLDKLGAVYLPEAVLCERNDGSLIPALVYLNPDMTPAATTDEYLDKITNPARKLGFPDWYIEKLESFRPY